MTDSYNPAAITETETLAILARIARYVRRHGSEYGEAPVPGGDHDEAVAVIVADWMGADWEALEWTFLQRNGRPLFSPDLSDMGRHMRAAIFMAGRARRRRWMESGPMRRAARAESRRRDMDDSTGASMASRAPDPARVFWAVENARVDGFRTIPDRFSRRRRREMKTRNTHGHTVEIVRRESDRTVITFAPWTRYNFRVVGDTSNREMPRTLRRVPEGWTRDTLREAVTG